MTPPLAAGGAAEAVLGNAAAAPAATGAVPVDPPVEPAAAAAAATSAPRGGRSPGPSVADCVAAMEGCLARDTKATRAALARRFRALAASGGPAALAAAYERCVAVRYGQLGLRGARLPPALATALADHFTRRSLLGAELRGKVECAQVLVGAFDVDLESHGIAVLQACATALKSKFAGQLVPRPPGAMVVDAEEDAAAAAIDALVAAAPATVTAAAVALVVPLVAGRVEELLPVDANVAAAAPATAVDPAAMCRAAVQRLVAVACPAEAAAGLAARQQAVRAAVDRVIAADGMAGQERLDLLGECLRMRLAALVYAGQPLPDPLVAAMADREVQQMRACPDGIGMLGDLVADGDLHSVVLIYLSRFVARAYTAACAAKADELRAARGVAPSPPLAATAPGDEDDDYCRAEDEDYVAAAALVAQEGSVLARWQTTSADPPVADVIAVIQLATEAAVLGQPRGDERMRDGYSALGKRDAAAPAPGDAAGRARCKPRGSGGGAADGDGACGDGADGGGPVCPRP